jgi:thiol-disulfide isomerase/thioredoxin
MIDIWASWCKPCIGEIPSIKKLEKEFPDICFISLSIDSSKAKWKKKVKELELHGNVFHVAESKYHKIMQVNGIPRFILYDKHGKLYTEKAPRPSNPEIRTILKRLSK